MPQKLVFRRDNTFLWINIFCFLAYFGECASLAIGLISATAEISSLGFLQKQNRTTRWVGSHRVTDGWDVSQNCRHGYITSEYLTSLIRQLRSQKLRSCRSLIFVSGFQERFFLYKWKSYTWQSVTRWPCLTVCHTLTSNLPPYGVTWRCLDVHLVQRSLWQSGQSK